jgi:3-phosphoshikimate 1-carboxyvinyltransferase
MSEIEITGELQSASYVDLTVEELAKSGIELYGYNHYIPCGQSYKRRSGYNVEGDYSQAAFFLVARELGCKLEVTGLNPESKQGDRAIVDIIELARQGGVEVDAADIPDLVPPAAALLALKAGETSLIYNAGRLRLKESDRLETITQTLNDLGANVKICGDALLIRGVETLRGGIVSSHNDHRIAMMSAVAAIRADSPVTVEGAEAVNKSYPDFWRDFEGGGIL